MSISNKLKRDHMCGDLRLEDVGKNITIMGWVSKARDLGGLIFIDLRRYVRYLPNCNQR